MVGALVDRPDRELAPDASVARDFTRSRKLIHFKKPPFRSMSQVALRFCLDNPALATVVPGFKNLAEVEDSVACSDLPPLNYDE